MLQIVLNRISRAMCRIAVTAAARERQNQAPAFRYELQPLALENRTVVESNGASRAVQSAFAAACGVAKPVEHGGEAEAEAFGRFDLDHLAETAALRAGTP
jgi:hypothetical protein